MKPSSSFLVLTNHGLAKFPIQQTSELLSEHKMLYKTVGGVLVSRSSRLRKLKLPVKLNRILNRSKSLPAANFIKISYIGELFWQIYLLLKRKNRFYYLQRISQFLSFTFVDLLAKRILVNSKNEEINLYHFRSGFGKRSLVAAKKLGIPTLCEHTTSHPDFRLQKIEKANEISFSIDKLMRHDLKSADFLLVPSEWVKMTIVEFESHQNISILTPPIDSTFIDYINELEDVQRDIDILFVGYVSRLKGFQRFYSIVRKLDLNVNVTIAGSWDSKLSEIKNDLQSIGNVTILDYVEHAEIARLMKRSKILLFPSLNEGAARVVEEAMHSGVLVMATGASFADFNQSAIYIDNMTDEEVSIMIKEILDSHTLRSELVIEAKAKLIKRDSEYFENLLRIYEKTQEFGNL